MSNEIAKEAINDSIRETRIVHLVLGASATDRETLSALEAEADDYASQVVEEGTSYEFWGTDEDGDEWRVHVVSTLA